jgi:hypothetical protein
LTHLGKFAKCDPNYCYDDNEGNEDEENEEEKEEDEDDDDSSWKIRKSTIKVIQAIAISRVEVIQDKDLFVQVSNELFGRRGECPR